MNTEGESEATEAEFSGLRRLEPSLPSRWYFEPAQYALELERIWRRNWIYLCRTDSIAQPGSYRTVTIGTQPVLVVRGEAGVLHAFYNTCRHRGAILCLESAGHEFGTKFNAHTGALAHWPLGPEQIELEIEWLFPVETLEDPQVDIRKVCDFSAQVMAEDASVCEINQRGLHAAAHPHGMLMPEEYDVFHLHQWLRGQFGDAA